MDVTLRERDKLILRALIQEYISTAEAIGSRTISKHAGLGLSPASVRNVMADLEDMGFLWQPHTSAGRIPTEKAFRFYVDYLLKVRKLDRREREKVRERYLPSCIDAEELLRRTALILSVLSDHIGVVVVPSLTLGELRHIQFIRVSQDQILAIMISGVGIAQHKIIYNTDGLTQDDLDKASRFLNLEMVGLTLFEVRQKILKEMQEEKIRFDSLLNRALKLGEMAISEMEGADVFVEGKLNILKEPEFADVEKMKAIFKAFEEKSKILKLLDKSMQAEGLNIFIGSENEFEGGKELSLVASPYQRGERVLGTLGIIGPTRMNYARTIAVVDFVAELVGELLEG